MSDTAVHKQNPASGAKKAAPKRGAGYAVYDPLGQKIGRAEEVFVNREGEPGYVRVRVGIFGLTVRADPGAVRRDRRDEKNPRPQVGSPCIPRKPRTKRSGDVFWGKVSSLGESTCIAFVFPSRKERCEWQRYLC